MSWKRQNKRYEWYLDDKIYILREKDYDVSKTDEENLEHCKKLMIRYKLLGIRYYYPMLAPPIIFDTFNFIRTSAT